MRTRRPVFARTVMSLLVAILGGLLGGGTSAFAASSVAIPIFGTVETDGKFHHPRRVILSIDLQNVSGQGLSTGTTYVTTGQDEVMRRLVASDLVEITFALSPNGAEGLTSARAGLASFTLTFDVSTGALTGGTATVSTP